VRERYFTVRGFEEAKTNVKLSVFSLGFFAFCTVSASHWWPMLAFVAFCNVGVWGMLLTNRRFVRSLPPELMPERYRVSARTLMRLLFTF
jgi:hypothetical protein